MHKLRFWSQPRYASSVFDLIAALCVVLPFTNAHAGEAEFHARRGVEAYEKQDYDEALSAFKKAAELRKDSPEIQYDLGTTLAQKGKYDEAIQTLGATLSGDKKDIEKNAQYNLGCARVKKAVEKEPPGLQNPVSHGAAGSDDAGPGTPLKSEEKLKLLRDGLENFRQAVIADPKDRDAKYNFETTRMIIRQIEEQLKQQQKQQDQGGGKDDKKNDQKQNGGNQDKGDKKEDQQGEQKEEGQNKDGQGEGDQQNKQDSKDGEDQKQEDQQNPKEQDSKEGQSQQSKQQDKGLDAKPTPGSDQKESKPSENKTGQAGARGSSDQKGASAGAAAQAQPDQKQLSPEEQDALRVLNALAEEKPDQFKKMFRFQGKGTGKKAERDW